jgi:hypothetical protein
MVSKSNKTSWYFFFILVFVLVAILVFFQFIPLNAVLALQASTFTWPALLMISILGLGGVWAASKTGFPDSWDKTIPNQQRILMPFLIGLGLGLIALVIEHFQPLGQIDVPFPVSIPFYLYGGIISEILLRQVLLPVPLWVISWLILRNRWQEPIFWGLAILVSALEPIGVLGGLYELGVLQNNISIGIWIFVAFAYGVNLLLAYEYRKHGFVAPVVLRLSFYLIWHILF